MTEKVKSLSDSLCETVECNRKLLEQKEEATGKVENLSTRVIELSREIESEREKVNAFRQTIASLATEKINKKEEKVNVVVTTYPYGQNDHNTDSE